MSYECSDFQETVFGMFQDAGLIPADADPEGASETADLVIAGFEALEKQRDDLLAALNGLFQHCAMVHKYWGENSNQRDADAAIEAAQAALAKAKGESK